MKKIFTLFGFLFLSFPVLADPIVGPIIGGGSASLNVVTTSSPTVTASAYTANYALGSLQTVSLFRTTGQPSGLLQEITLASKGGITATEVIYAFRKSPASTCTDHSAFVLSSTDLPYLVPGFPVSVTPAALAGTTQTIANATVNVSTSNADSSATTNLYLCVVTTGTPTPASTADLVLNISGVQD